MESPSLGFVKRKRKRVGRACDFCHLRGLKCKRPDSDLVQGCLTCEEYSVPCTHTRTPQKRGTKPGASKKQGRLEGPNVHSSTAENPIFQDNAVPWDRLRDLGEVFNSRSVISAWIDVYLDTIHPVYAVSSRNTEIF